MLKTQIILYGNFLCTSSKPWFIFNPWFFVVGCESVLVAINKSYLNNQLWFIKTLLFKNLSCCGWKIRNWNKNEKNWFCNQNLYLQKWKTGVLLFKWKTGILFKKKIRNGNICIWNIDANNFWDLAEVLEVHTEYL